MKVVIRLLTDSDLEEAARILESAFQHPGSWLIDLRILLTIQPDGYYGAYWDGKLVGMVGAIIYPAFAYVGMMGVHRDFQHQGIGMVLMQRLMSRLDEQKVPLVLLDASKAGQPLYEKLSFTALDNIYNFQKKPGQPAREQPGGIHLLTPRDLDSIIELDARAFGTDRRRVLEALLRVYPGRAFVSRDKLGQVNGYLIAQEKRIGPWVARGTADAEHLLQAALSLPSKDSFSVYVPGINTEATRLLQRYGFEAARTNCHMVHGPGAPLDQRNLVFGQVSLSIG